MPDDGTSPLSLDSALSLMSADETQRGVSEEGTQTSDKTADTSAETADKGTTNTDASATAKADTEAAKDTPVADEGKTNDEDADQGDALPTIEPPSSWKAEEKAVWESLPRTAQEAIQRREQDRTTELRNLQNSTAEQRKTADAEVTRLKGLADQISTYVQTEVKELARAFPEIKTEADVAALAERDPARFAVFQAKLMQFNSARQAEADAQKELSTRANQQQQETLTKAKDALLTAFPTWKDPQVARKELTELQDYAIKLGVPEQAARTTLDPFVYKLAQKAMLYDRAQTAKAAAINRDPPRVVSPGPGNSGSRADKNAESRQSQLSKLTKSGDLEDAIGLLRIS